MKKNAMLKIAAILMVAVLLTTCAISSTFAKYTTSSTDDVDARVAKWGVEVSASVDGLFAVSYADGTSADVAAAQPQTKEIDGPDGTKIEVADNVLAPGTTKGLTLAGTITGTPEVAVAVTYDAEIELDNWSIDGVEYCPIVFTVGNDSFSTLTVTPTSGQTKADALEAAVEAAIEAAYAKTYGPNEDISAADSVKISWAWGYDADTLVDNTKDTALGNQADEGTPATVTFTLTLKVEQLDKYPVA